MKKSEIGVYHAIEPIKRKTLVDCSLRLKRLKEWSNPVVSN